MSDTRLTENETNAAPYMIESVKVEVIHGTQGIALYINDMPVAGPNLWNGGSRIHGWQTTNKAIDKALGRAALSCSAPQPATGGSRHPNPPLVSGEG